MEFVHALTWQSFHKKAQIFPIMVMYSYLTEPKLRTDPEGDSLGWPLSSIALWSRLTTDSQ